MAANPIQPDQQNILPPGQQPPHSGQEPTADDPNRQTPEQSQQASDLSDEDKEALMALRKKFKLRWATDRRTKIRHVRRCFEVLRNRPWTVLESDGFTFSDPFEQGINGGSGSSKGEDDLYFANDNIYQMLHGSYQAALSRNQSKTRYMPEDADDELDVATARRGSDAMAYIERRNKIKRLQKRELLHLWTSGCYFSYSRYLIDSERAGITKQPITELVPTEVAPDRYTCKRCGQDTPAESLSPMSKPRCAACGAPLGEDDFQEAQSIPVPKNVGYSETPNGMVAIDVFGALNVDVAPYAENLNGTPLLDLEMEQDVASIRASYPEAWTKISQGGSSTGSTEGDTERAARMAAVSQNASGMGLSIDRIPTFSRCWMHAWAFNEIDDKVQADRLKQKFPKGVKLVSMSGETFLEAKPEKLTECWTWAPKEEGMGMYPPGVGDPALDVQDRINDVATIVHEHMESASCGPILVNEDWISGKALDGKRIRGGTILSVKPKAQLANKSLSEALWQPQFHLDANIYKYGLDLVELAQLVAGIRPELFGGSDDNVETWRGQKQQLNQAVARLLLYLDQINEEHAERSEVAVKCMATNMFEDLRHVVEGDTDSGFANEYILMTEMQGSFHAYAEADQGFPATYAEQKDLIVSMLGEGKDNPFVMEMMEVPDNQSTVMRMVGPPGMKLPNEDARAKIKRVIAQLSQEAPQETIGPDMMPMYMPSEQPDKDVDDMQLIKQLVIEWAMKNFTWQKTKPMQYENVKAYMKLAGQYFAEAQAKQMVTQSMVAGANAPPAPSGGAPPAAPPPS